MRLIIATGTPGTIARLRECPDAGGFELREGSVPSTSAGCDVAFVSLPLAAERYGADPTNHDAQVLVNERGDGAPGAIVTQPALRPDADGNESGYGAWVAWALECSLEAMRSALGPLDGLTALLHLEAAAMDREPCETMRVLAQAAR